MDRRNVRAAVVRAVLAAALTVAVTALGLVAPAPASAGPAQGFALAAVATITPGAPMITPFDSDTASSCTAAFVFAGDGAVYLGYAAHCAGAGSSTGLSGCEEPALPLGSTVLVEGNDGERTSARLAYSSWHTMQERGETDETLCSLNDFALVALDPSDVGSVNPSVPGLGGPTGLDSDGTERGEPVASYQPFGGGPALKQGSSLGDSDGGRTHRVVTQPPGEPGDSGSGYLDGRGAAFGVLSTQFIDDAPSNGVTDLALALRYANRYGELGRVSLVPGTEPFTP